MPRAPPASTELRATKSTKLTGLNPSILARASVKRDPGPVSRYPSIHPFFFFFFFFSSSSPLSSPSHSSISQLQPLPTSTSILLFSFPFSPSLLRLPFFSPILLHPDSLSPIDLTSIDPNSPTWHPTPPHLYIRYLLTLLFITPFAFSFLLFSGSTLLWKTVYRACLRVKHVSFITACNTTNTPVSRR
ncbi:hypothetical protein BJX96DRAFT_135731 [Aspergillus floccosus]